MRIEGILAKGGLVTQCDTSSRIRLVFGHRENRKESVKIYIPYPGNLH